MFISHKPFRHRVQPYPESTVWAGVELALGTPLFIVTCDRAMKNGGSRQFLLHGTNELMALTQQQPVGPILSVQLLQPPAWSEGRKWTLVEIGQVLLQLQPPDGSMPSAVVRGRDGALYGGHPVRPIEGDPGPLEELAVLQERCV